MRTHSPRHALHSNSAISKHHGNWGSETKPAPRSRLHKCQKSLHVEKRRAGGESWDTWGNGENWAEMEIILKTTGMSENLEVTRKYTYNIKPEREQVTPLHRQDSKHRAADQMVRLWEGSEHICQSASTFSINVLDALIQPKDSDSSKPRCPELNFPTPGWCMWITCVFSEMHTRCCQSKQANIVGLSEVTQTWIILPKTTTIRSCIGEINPTLWADLFNAKGFFFYSSLHLNFCNY